MLRFSILPVLVALAVPVAGRGESIDVAPRPAEAAPADGWVPVVRGPAPVARQPAWTEPGRAGNRAVFDAAGESPETSARAAVVVVRGATGAAVQEVAGDADLAFQLALVRMLTGLCRLDPRIRDAAAEELLAPLPASF
jgi:hypothetical protein